MTVGAARHEDIDVAQSLAAIDDRTAGLVVAPTAFRFEIAPFRFAQRCQ